MKMSPLLVAFFAFCACISNAAAQTKQINGNRFIENASKCGLYEFHCHNGQCISAALLCDGRPDCLDSSDETSNECNKPGASKCTAEKFRCDYGACVNGIAACNGIKDCADNSDENSARCRGGGSGTGGINEPPRCRNDQHKCDSGQCISSSELCNGNVDCLDRSDETLKTCGSYNCTPKQFRCNYGACIDRELMCDGKTQCSDSSDENPQLCNINPTDSRPTTVTAWRPADQEFATKNTITCSPLDTRARKATCKQPNGKEMSCDSTGVPPETSAKLTCRNNYLQDTTDPRTPVDVKCSAEGEWKPKPINCNPECGIASTSRATARMINGSTTRVSEFPWHGTLYRKKRHEKKVVCGATIIKDNMLVTAAHCVYDETSTRVDEPNEFYVTVGNVFRDYDSEGNNPQTYRKAGVKKIYAKDNYSGMLGSYAMDIAIIVIDEPLEFSSQLMPICLDTTDTTDQTALEVGNYGRVPGFGGTATEDTGFILQAITVPYVSLKVCKDESVQYGKERFLTIDKFCAGYTNGTATCGKDGGGGLVFQTNGKWYLRGILSLGLGMKLVSGVRTCDRQSYSLYTRISYHMDWIVDIMNKEESNKPYVNLGLDTTERTTISTRKTTISHRQSSTAYEQPEHTTRASLLLNENLPNQSGNNYYCTLPPKLQNGWYEFNHCVNQQKCELLPGITEVKHGDALVYNCDAGYKLNTSDSRIYCSSVGTWSAIPICEAVTCPPLESESRLVTCITSTGKSISCDEDGVLPGISAKLTCNNGYSRNTSDSTASDAVECNTKGMWEPEPIDCLQITIPETSTRWSMISPQQSTGANQRLEHTTASDPNVRPLSGKNYCPLPPQPRNGRYRLHDNRCPDEPCGVSSDMTEVEQGGSLVYNCDSGYRLNTSDSTIFCSAVGTWSVIPVCEEITCPPLASVSRVADCMQATGGWISCESTPVPAGTSAKLTCRNSYVKDARDLMAFERVKCNAKGEWEPKPINCVTVCGVASTSAAAPLIVHGTMAHVTEFPWHGTLYRSNSLQKQFLCGATIIKENMLITAAHCVYDNGKVNEPSQYYVAVGNQFKDFDYEKNDAQTYQMAQVKDIYVQCHYMGMQGNYAMDIAILVINKPLVFSSLLMPICLDTAGLGDITALEVGNSGRVPGFGRTASGEASFVLQSITVPYVSQKDCKAKSTDSEDEKYLTADKFCAGYTNGTTVCHGDSGGGLVFKNADGKWFLRGIVSIGIGSRKKGGVSRCDSHTYSLYTRVSNHMSWIQTVMDSVENNKPHNDCH